jgi:glycosyltransferase involved in cell wall biosynthesis
VPLVPPAIEAARRELPGLTCTILGDGPETEATRERIRALGLKDVVELRGRVDHDEVMRSIAAASCLLHPSEREGYGLVIVEAASLGTPAVAVAEPENAANVLIDEGVNGYVGACADAGDLAASVIAAVRGGAALRESTTGWYEHNRERLAIESSLARVEASYSEPDPG